MLAVRKDIPSAGHQASGANALNGEGGRETSNSVTVLSQALIIDLGAYHQQIVKAALLRDPAATPDVLHYALCMQQLSGERGPGRTLQSAHFVEMESRTKLEDTGQGRAFDEIEQTRASLPLEWLASKTEGERFAAFRTPNKRAKDKLVAFCTVLSLAIGLCGSFADQETLIDRLCREVGGFGVPIYTQFSSAPFFG